MYYSKDYVRVNSVSNYVSVNTLIQPKKYRGISVSPPSGAYSRNKENQTGLPDGLKTSIENLSGADLSDIRVHYNSAKPTQLEALAYTQGKDIYVGPDQEKNLPHEAWHAVQQMQGRVKPTAQMKGIHINDDPSMEHEADVLGEKAAQFHNENNRKSPNVQSPAPYPLLRQLKRNEDPDYHSHISPVFTLIPGTVDMEQERATVAPVQFTWHYSTTRFSSSNHGNTVYYHYSVDDTDVRSLHVTFFDRENYDERNWAMRMGYTPTHRDRGAWDPVATNHGEPPQWAIAIANNNLDTIRQAAINYAMSIQGWATLRNQLAAYVPPPVVHLHNQWALLGLPRI